jgi:hypothetical protein
VLNAFAGFKTFNRSAPFKMLGCSDHDVGEVEVSEVPITSAWLLSDRYSDLISR